MSLVLLHVPDQISQMDQPGAGQGGRQTLLAGFVGYRPGQFLQVLGQSRSPGDVASEQILASIRSIAMLRDPDKRNVTADRVHVVITDHAGTFTELVGKMGPQALSLEETAILNNMRATTTYPAGTPIKIVQKGRHPTRGGPGLPGG